MVKPIFTFRFLAAALVYCVFYSTPLFGQSYELKPSASPADNPLKGLVPYARPMPNRFPHSMEFQYFALSDLMLDIDKFDWIPLEELLDDVASRGNQAVVRVYMEYPGKEKGIPKFLVDGGLKVHRYLNTNTAPFPPTKVITPDYEDPRLREALKNFIAAFGKRYDNDPRLAYITAGLLGTWGEWHTYPKDELWASNRTQSIVLDAYEAAFKSTPVLLRYPAGPNHYAQAENASRAMGYHDDSFAWATLSTGRKQDDWFYMPALKTAGKQATEKWTTQPIGGEIRPEVWGKIFDDQSTWPKQAQSFHDCVSQTHATWLMDTGMFREQAKPDRMATALAEVQRMGYDFYVQHVDITTSKTGSTQLKIDVINQGVAPLYADWDTEIALLNSEKIIAYRQTDDQLSFRGLLPSAEKHSLTTTFEAPSEGSFTVLLRVINPLKGGKPLRFANEDQDKSISGWLTLGQLIVQPE
ncbi:DUF4832 domain-containing protein [Stieleria sp. JC731]|uniref:DUF4832 domain-containing protein n=1 Tax=Pirellulaceae TaxID=2691357 RepID=UPI001E46A1FF|nr:DUF4832 domain-containing protein [Stieleria sp. JC731]MCC9603896.1 DUF4832 domain-containing protein [Stieleria sp. JC731]